MFFYCPTMLHSMPLSTQGVQVSCVSFSLNFLSPPFFFFLFAFFFFFFVGAVCRQSWPFLKISHQKKTFHLLLFLVFLFSFSFSDIASFSFSPFLLFFSYAVYSVKCPSLLLSVALLYFTSSSTSLPSIATRAYMLMLTGTPREGQHPNSIVFFETLLMAH